MNYTEVAGFITRDGTTDANAVYALADDEYRLAGRTLSGWAIDVGAHIGTVSITMARQNPDLRVLAVEAVPDNADLLERNIIGAGLGDRIIAVRAAAARPGELIGTCRYGYTHREEEGDGYVSAHRFVGNTWANLGEPEFDISLPAVSLDSLMADYGIADLALLKIDCEGCEWAFLDTDLSRVATVVGEYHGGYSNGDTYQVNPRDRIMELFAPTHDVEFWNADPTIGLFEAVRR